MSPHAKVLVDRACKWVMSACKPLSSDELLSAIVVDSENDAFEFKKETDESCLQALCNNMLVLDSERRVWRVTHLSVVEYFEDHHWSFRQAHCHAAKVCLRLLNVMYKSPTYHINIEGSGDRYETEVPNMNDVADQFQRYVQYHWMNHVRTYEEQVAKEEQEADPSLARLLKRFLGSPNESSFQYRTWYRFLDDEHWKWPMSSLLAGIHKWDISPEEVTIFAMCKFSLFILLRDWWNNAEITCRQENKDGKNLLMMATEAGCKSIRETLVERGLKENITLSNEEYGRALVTAASRGHLNIARFLVEKGAEPDVVISSGRYRSALAAAASQGHLDIVQFLVEKGAEPDLTLSCGDYGSALAAAAYEGNLDIAQFLIKEGAKPNLILSSGRYGSALAAAASMGFMDIAQFLVEKGAEPNLVLPNGIYGSALAAAACEGHIDVVKLFLQNDANATIADSREYWLTRNAALDGHNDLGGIPLQASAVFSNPQSAIGRTPLFFAAKNGHTQIAELLLTHRASPYIKDHYGSTAIFAAVRNGHEGVVKCLLELQDSMDCKDGFGRSLFWWAKMSGNVTIFELLLGYSQKIGVSIPKIDLDLEFRSVPLKGLQRSRAWCDVCTRDILDESSHHVCSLCSEFHVCVDCFGMGGRCLYHTYELVFKAA